MYTTTGRDRKKNYNKWVKGFATRLNVSNWTFDGQGLNNLIIFLLVDITSAYKMAFCEMTTMRTKTRRTFNFSPAISIIVGKFEPKTSRKKHKHRFLFKALKPNPSRKNSATQLNATATHNFEYNQNDGDAVFFLNLIVARLWFLTYYIRSHAEMTFIQTRMYWYTHMHIRIKHREWNEKKKHRIFKKKGREGERKKFIAVTKNTLWTWFEASGNYHEFFFLNASLKMRSYQNLFEN